MPSARIGGVPDLLLFMILIDTVIEAVAKQFGLSFGNRYVIDYNHDVDVWEVTWSNEGHRPDFEDFEEAVEEVLRMVTIDADRGGPMRSGDDAHVANLDLNAEQAEELNRELAKGGTLTRPPVHADPHEDQERDEAITEGMIEHPVSLEPMPDVEITTTGGPPMDMTIDDLGYFAAVSEAVDEGASMQISDENHEQHMWDLKQRLDALPDSEPVGD